MSYSLLKILVLNQSRKGIKWRWYMELYYNLLKYHQFQELTISIVDEKGTSPHFLKKKEMNTKGKMYAQLRCRLDIWNV